MKVSKKRAEEFAIKINEDMDIDDAAFEAKYQHIRDDLLYYASKGVVNLDKVADFHGQVVFRLYEKYFGGEKMGVYSQYEVYPSEYDWIDNSMCDNCPYAHGVCWKAGYCIVEDVN